MTAAKRNTLLHTLQARFEKHAARHPNVAWQAVEAAIQQTPSALAVLQRMEDSGGEPDVIPLEAGVVSFVDCAVESPAGRRSLCFDREARTSRKENAPAGSAQEMADEMGVALLTEAEYATLQRYGAFDLKTSSWLATPAEVRTLGGAIFGDRRYNRVFTYHNGAQSYYAARGFRGVVRL
ncbi:DUF4256 domain-containing protein [Gemmatimonas sp.]